MDLSTIEINLTTSVRWFEHGQNYVKGFVKNVYLTLHTGHSNSVNLEGNLIITMSNRCL